ncbi:MAG: hypothetical protein ABSB83_04295 [Methanomassiliicoccales archaeon]|jgi:molybdopterin converting factor small subunit
MAVKVKLFGILKDKAHALDGTGMVGIVEMDGGKVRNITDILRALDLKEDDVSHLFVNNDYSGLMRAVSDGDTVAIFPRNMALLYKWYFTKKQ